MIQVNGDGFLQVVHPASWKPGRSVFRSYVWLWGQLERKWLILSIESYQI